jgi:hypothetical protein
MAIKKQHRDFPALKPENLNVRKKHFLSDLELALLSNFTIYQEHQLLAAINMSQKFRSRTGERFRIPYERIEELFGMNRKAAKRHLTNLREKNILVMVQPMSWSWNIPGIAKMLGPVEIIQEPKALPNRTTSDKVIFISNPIEDPLLKGLPEDWDKI